MSKSRILNVANVSYNGIRENKILANISKFIVPSEGLTVWIQIRPDLHMYNIHIHQFNMFWYSKEPSHWNTSLSTHIRNKKIDLMKYSYQEACVKLELFIPFPAIDNKYRLLSCLLVYFGSLYCKTYELYRGSCFIDFIKSVGEKR